ncbi:MAG: hypothetical protein K6C35_08845 [Eubacterium sp.]|nr:hypothetical protein [Eubacterium sp.]
MGDFTEGIGFLENARDIVHSRDDLKKFVDQNRDLIKKLEKEKISEEKSIEDEIASTIKKRRNDIESDFDKKINSKKSDVKKVEKSREKDKSAQVNARVAEATKDYHTKNASLEKELKIFFKNEGVPNFCSSRFYYTMFMPKGGEILKKLLYMLLFAAGIPSLLLLLLWNTAFRGLTHDKKMLFAIIIAVAWVLLFIVVYFVIYVNTKVRYIDAIREGRKYRDAIKNNQTHVNKITNDINKDKDESLYDLGEFDDKIKKIDKSMNKLIDEKNDALKEFDKKTKGNISEDIKKKRQKRLDEIISQKDKAQGELTKAAEELEAAEKKVQNVAEIIGKENCNAQKIDRLIEVMESGTAETVSAAIAYLKINK